MNNGLAGEQRFGGFAGGSGLISSDHETPGTRSWCMDVALAARRGASAAGMVSWLCLRVCEDATNDGYKRHPPAFV